jgi:hypothetical protein
MRFIALALCFAGAAVAAPVSVTLPGEMGLYPDLGRGAPAADAINNNCLGCHSAEMVLTQPRLTPAEWQAEVAKMRNVFKAPIDPADDAAIVAWAVEWSKRLPAG